MVRVMEKLICKCKKHLITIDEMRGNISFIKKTFKCPSCKNKNRFNIPLHGRIIYDGVIK